MLGRLAENEDVDREIAVIGRTIIIQGLYTIKRATYLIKRGSSYE